MGPFYSSLFYTLLGGGIVLLGVESVARLRLLRKPVTAGWLTLLAGLWWLLPAQGRWMLSLWSPGTILGGQIVLDMQPALWWCGFVLSVIFAGAAWIEVTERRATLPLTGPLVSVALLVMWIALLSGSLLTTLAAWAVFDLVWCVAGLMSGADGERVTFGLTLHGIASVIVWTVTLLLLRGGKSGLWWLLWPSPPIMTLLLVAALIRVGFYPFQIVFPRGVGLTRSLGMVYLMGPITGVSLLYRLLLLPGTVGIPSWVLLWGVLSLVWCGLMAWTSSGRQPLAWAAHALLVIIVAGSAALGSAELLMMGTATWVAAGTLLILARGQDQRAVMWSWPAWLAILLLIGVPPSPVGTLFDGLSSALPWVPRLLLLLGAALVNAIFILSGSQPALGSATPPKVWQRLSMSIALGMLVLVLAGTAILSRVAPISIIGFGSWFLAVMLAGGVAYSRRSIHRGLRHSYPVMEFLDMQWFYRAMWRGAEHMLGVLRTSADIIEGSGALLWSLLIVLLILLAASSQ